MNNNDDKRRRNYWEPYEFCDLCFLLMSQRRIFLMPNCNWPSYYVGGVASKVPKFLLNPSIVYLMVNKEQKLWDFRRTQNALRNFGQGRICLFATNASYVSVFANLLLKKNGQKPRKKRLQQNSVCLDKIFGSISKSFGERSTKSDGQRRLWDSFIICLMIKQSGDKVSKLQL